MDETEREDASGGGGGPSFDGRLAYRLSRLELSVGTLLAAVALFAFALIIRPTHDARSVWKSPELVLSITPPVESSSAVSQQPNLVPIENLSKEEASAVNRAYPFSDLPNPPAKPFDLVDRGGEDGARAQHCLAQAVFYEAASESLAGQQAVAQVVLNRVRHAAFPKTVCGVVFQGSELRTGCQFSFTCDGSMVRAATGEAWASAQRVAAAALHGFVMTKVGEATHYHTQYVVPFWSPTLVKLVQVGAHIFYRWTGAEGQPPAFEGRYAGFEQTDRGQTTSLPVSLPATAAVSALPAGQEPLVPSGPRPTDQDIRPAAAPLVREPALLAPSTLEVTGLEVSGAAPRPSQGAAPRPSKRDSEYWWGARKIRSNCELPSSPCHTEAFAH